MPHWADRAFKDANDMYKPRKITKFVCRYSGICELCGVGLGKRFTRDLRVDHQQGHQHTFNYERYTAKFEADRSSYVERLRKEHYLKRKELGRQVAEDDVSMAAAVTHLMQSVGLDCWMETAGDVVTAKAAVLDLMLDLNSKEARTTASAATDRHIRLASRVLVHQASASVLSNDAEGAHTVGSLCAACL